MALFVRNNLLKYFLQGSFLFLVSLIPAHGLYVDTSRDFHSGNSFEVFAQVNQVAQRSLPQLKISAIQPKISSLTSHLPVYVTVLSVQGIPSYASVSPVQIFLPLVQEKMAVWHSIREVLVNITIPVYHSPLVLGKSPRYIKIAGDNLTPLKGEMMTKLITHTLAPSEFSVEALHADLVAVVREVPHSTHVRDISFSSLTGGTVSSQGLILGASAYNMATDAEQTISLPFLDEFSLKLFCALSSASGKIEKERCKYGVISVGTSINDLTLMQACEDKQTITGVELSETTALTSSASSSGDLPDSFGSRAHK